MMPASLPKFIDEKPAIAHNQIAGIDGSTALAGLSNITEAAEGTTRRTCSTIKMLRSGQILGELAGVRQASVTAHFKSLQTLLRVRYRMKPLQHPDPGFLQAAIGWFEPDNHLTRYADSIKGTAY